MGSAWEAQGRRFCPQDVVGGVPRTAPLPSWGFPGAGRGHAGADLGSAGGGVPPSAPGRGRSRRRRRQVSERLLEVGFVDLHAVVMGVAARYPVPSTVLEEPRV